MFLYIHIFIYLAVPGLGGSMWDFQSSFWHSVSLVAACELLIAAYGIQFPDWGSVADLLHWEHRVLATRSPGKSSV